jgi:hypothetical protein
MGIWLTFCSSARKILKLYHVLCTCLSVIISLLVHDYLFIHFNTLLHFLPKYFNWNNCELTKLAFKYIQEFLRLNLNFIQLCILNTCMGRSAHPDNI